MGKGDAWLWARCPGAGGSGIAALRGDGEEAGAELGAVPLVRAEPEVCPDRGPIGSLLPKLSFWRNFPPFLSCCVVSHALGFKKAVGTCPGLVSLCVLSKDRCFTVTAALLAGEGGRGEQPH